MSGKRVEFFFDYASPFAYLGSTQVERVCEEAGAELVLKPFLLGGLFRSIGTPMVPVMSFSEAKRSHAMQDMLRWAEYWSIPFAFPTRFPMRSVEPLRLTFAVDDAMRLPLMHRIFKAFWVEDRDISSADELRALSEDIGVDPGLVDTLGDETLKTELREATEEAVNRGVCGVPTFIVGDMLIWGQDRLEFVTRALEGWRPPKGH